MRLEIFFSKGDRMRITVIEAQQLGSTYCISEQTGIISDYRGVAVVISSILAAAEQCEDGECEVYESFHVVYAYFSFFTLSWLSAGLAYISNILVRKNASSLPGISIFCN